MTDKEVAEIIKVARAEVEWEYPMDYAAAFDRVIEALEQEPCEDAISRSDILERCQLVIGQGLSDKNGYHMVSAETIMDVVKQLPSVYQKPKTGHWIEDENEMEVRCSECGEENDKCSKYCPNCGRRIVEPQESENS